MQDKTSSPSPTPMMKNLQIAFKYSCICFLFVLARSIYLMATYDPGAGIYMQSKTSFTDLVFFYLPTLAFYTCLVWSHRSYIRQTPQYSFTGILVISLLFLLITYCLTYANGYLGYHLYYKKHSLPQSQTGLLGLIEAFSQPQEPKFSPFNDLLWYPVKDIIRLARAGLVRELLHYMITAKAIILLLVLYYESLYYLFRKYRQQNWYYILPVINKWKLTEIARKPKWYFYILLIPFVRLYLLYIINRQIARDFRKGEPLALVMTFLPSFGYGIVGLNSGEQPAISADIEGK